MEKDLATMEREAESKFAVGSCSSKSIKYYISLNYRKSIEID